jgi:hypothetical protein
MTVKELINNLSNIDGDKIVVLTEPDGIGWIGWMGSANGRYPTTRYLRMGKLMRLMKNQEH